MKAVSEDRDNREEQSQNIQPERSSDGTVAISAEAQFEQQGREPDCGHDDHGQWAGKCGTARIEHDEGERQQKQASRH